MKDWREIITKHLSFFVEILAAVVIAIALHQFIIRYLLNIFQPNIETINQKLSIQFGSSLALALELLLDADILVTAIAVLRTGLNFFLERELRTSGLDDKDRPITSFLK